MRNLHIDSIDLDDCWDCQTRVKQCEWMIDKIKMTNEWRTKIRQELEDVIFDCKELVWKISILDEDYFDNK